MAYVKGKNGEFTVTGGNFTAKVVWSETYDISANTSIVSIDKLAIKSNVFYGVEYYPNGAVTVNGETVAEFSSLMGTHRFVPESTSAYYDVIPSTNAYSGAPWVASAITHNTDGKKEITIAIDFRLMTISGNYQSGTRINGSSNIALTDIPRAATLTAAPNFTDEDNPTITYNNPAGSVVEKLEACISLTSARADIAYRNISKTGTSYTFTLTDAERAVLRNATLDGSDSRTVYFIVQTTIGGNTYRSSLAKTFTVTNADPEVSALVMDVNETTVALTGDRLTTLIKGYSNAAYEISATAKKGASIASYKATSGSKSFTTSSGTFTAVQASDFSFTATDNRGISATKSIKLKLIDYFKPSCNAEGTLELDGETSAKATVKISGTFFNGSFGSVKNAIVIQIKHTGLTDWVTLTDGLVPVLNGNSYSLTFTVSGLSYDETFTYQCRVSDKLASASSAEDSLNIYPVFDWSAEDFNFNVPISLNNNQTLRTTDTGRLVISANEGDIYLRPNGTNTDSGQMRLMTDGRVAFNGVTMNDFVVERGTSGIWRYEKWNSGICKLYGNITYTPSTTGTLHTTYAYPFTLKDDPVININITRNFSVCSSIYPCKTNGNYTNPYTVLDCCFMNVTTSSYAIYAAVSVISKWK